MNETYKARFVVPFKTVDMGMTPENERFFRAAREMLCKSEDDHDFDTAGQCRKCKAHRRPR